MTELVAENLKKVYGGRAVVRDVTIRVPRGRITGLLGKNGAGKTTTFYMVVGVVQPDGGRILLGDQDITRLPMHKRARLGIGYLAQEASVFRDLSVEDNVLAVLEFMGLSRRQRAAKTDELLEELSLQHVRGSLGRSLSGGERRRAEIARALASDPEFILLDEPFAGVDPIATKEIKRIVSYLCDKGLGVLITDHDAKATLEICEYTYVMADGMMMVEGDSDTIVNDPVARDCYLGDDFEMGPASRKASAEKAAAKAAAEKPPPSDPRDPSEPTPEASARDPLLEPTDPHARYRPPPAQAAPPPSPPSPRSHPPASPEPSQAAARPSAPPRASASARPEARATPKPTPEARPTEPPPKSSPPRQAPPSSPPRAPAMPEPAQEALGLEWDEDSLHAFTPEFPSSSPDSLEKIPAVWPPPPGEALPRGARPEPELDEDEEWPGGPPLFPDVTPRRRGKQKDERLPWPEAPSSGGDP